MISIKDAEQIKKPAAQAASTDTTDNQARSETLLSKAAVLEITNKTFPTIWSWMRQGKFPAARQVGERPMWLESEINDWISNLPVRRYLSVKQSEKKQTKRAGRKATQ